MNTNKDIIFPPFVSLFINDVGKTCVYYYRGLTSNNTYAYQLFKEEDLPEHTKTINNDGSVIYTFDKKIKKIQCKLISENFENKKISISL